MKSRTSNIVDAGPALNFMSINQERLLVEVLGDLCAPEVVYKEVVGKSKTDARFSPAQKVLDKLVNAGRFTILSDAPLPEILEVLERLNDLPPMDQLASPKDLGEKMAIAHAVTRAEAGGNCLLLIDDGGGRALAKKEIGRLGRGKLMGNKRSGQIWLVSTEDILARAVHLGLIATMDALKKLYGRMRALDDGLVPFSDSRLSGIKFI
ncbi:hypothetical protein CPHO_03895 [Corynebacterium phocae]|uniref:DUF3368 domain-containing protein n=1 Tax=Corynebacterium phocae TaxID=161895 RepID=A0A1L7D209_9CORY|nr:PIN domain-containing protein [Corynebacterium phocae]APT92169.1 hypothetical protein CPHO_03895 [Corynebacterium phocae]KAA8725956.1 hypothetical protein F4V58_03440 [Corynebacterium phocae]